MAIVELKKTTSVVTRRVLLVGTKPIMFDRYAGDNQTKLEPWQKLYFRPGDSKVIGLPAANIVSFLSAHNTNSAPKRLRDARQFKKICNECLSFTEIEEDFIPFLRDGKELSFGKLDKNDESDPNTGIFVHHSVARLEKGIPNPKARPVLPLPWALEFHMKLWPSNIKEQEIQNLFEEGGRAIGLGTYRGLFGKFIVGRWA